MRRRFATDWDDPGWGSERGHSFGLPFLPPGEPDVYRGEHEQSQESRGHQSADYDCRQWPLHLGTHSVRQGDGQKADARHEGGHDDRAKPLARALDRGLRGRLTSLPPPLNRREQDQAIEDGTPKRAMKPMEADTLRCRPRSQSPRIPPTAANGRLTSTSPASVQDWSEMKRSTAMSAIDIGTTKRSLAMARA